MIMPDGEVLVAKITAKETTGRNEPNPIYTIETIDVKKPTLLAPSSVEGIERMMGGDAVATQPTGGLKGNIAEMVDDVKRAARTVRDSRGLFKGGDTETYGAFYPGINTIALFKNANLSTFLHETGHFFLWSDINLATRLLAEAKGRPLPAGRQRIVDDAKVLLDWFGVKDLETWNRMSLDEQRGHHEKFAVAFEKYLYDGQAPSVGLLGMFRRFREWLVNVYRDGRLEGVTFSPEVREVFDRMLATDMQIAEMREVQGMSAKFRTAEEAGMTTEPRNKQALTEARASALRRVRPNPAGSKTRAKANILLRDHPVKKGKPRIWRTVRAPIAQGCSPTERL
jgi:hypothetical protein